MSLPILTLACDRQHTSCTTNQRLATTYLINILLRRLLLSTWFDVERLRRRKLPEGHLSAAGRGDTAMYAYFYDHSGSAHY